MKVGEVIKTIIGEKTCPLHGVHPVIDTTTSEIKIHTCCSAFHEACAEQVNSILTGIDVSSYWSVA